jgi:hypothetical protein
MKSMLQRGDVRGFVAAIFLMGFLRFVLTMIALPDSLVKFFSMSVIILVGTVYFAIRTATHKERRHTLLLFPYKWKLPLWDTRGRQGGKPSFMRRSIRSERPLRCTRWDILSAG